jgi:hypothetical protein
MDKPSKADADTFLLGAKDCSLARHGTPSFTMHRPISFGSLQQATALVLLLAKICQRASESLLCAVQPQLFPSYHMTSENHLQT